MKKLYILTLTLILTFFQLNAQTEWTGPSITFSKASFADWELEANQDRITSNVWITRKNDKLFFNIFSETAYEFNTSPADTEWAIGSISDDVNTLTFGIFTDIVVNNDGDPCPPCGLNIPLVLHLITDDIYIDFTLTSWNNETTAPSGDQSNGFGDPGGQFTYQRSTDQSLSINNIELKNNIILFPNPSNELLQISGLKQNENFKIYNILGAEIKNGIISNNEIIDIKNFTNGLYFLKFDNGNTVKFIKE